MSNYLIKTTYQEIASHDLGAKKCTRCHKTITKNFKESQTINPWNNKTPAEIREQNRQGLKVQISEWVEKKEECAACVKSKIPDITLDYLTLEDWNKTEEIRNEIKEVKDRLHYLNETFENQLKGKHLKIDVRGKQRIIELSQIHHPSSVNYTFVRKDLKGLTEKGSYCCVGYFIKKGWLK